MSKNKFVPRKVNGKIQRAKTYAPGTDVICVRGPILAIDTIRSRAKKLDVSISRFIIDLVMPKKTAKKKAAKASKSAAKTETKAANTNGVAAPAKADPKPEASAA